VDLERETLDRRSFLERVTDGIEFGRQRRHLDSELSRHSLCSRRSMGLMLMWLALMFGAILTMPVWSYSANWKRYPSSACFALATIGALLVVAGVI
jgi:hypothetical protein